MKRIVVYTGSFNPPTLAHFEVMEKAMETVNADLGLFLPTCDNHIKNKMINKMERLSLNGEIRCEMLESFCKKHKNIKVCDYEIKIKDSSSTYKSFSYLKSLYPDSEIFYIMGADKLFNLPHWKNIDKFLKNFKFVVFDRSDIDALKIIDNNDLFKRYNDRFIVAEELDGLSEVSSSKIRDMFINNNKDYRNYLSKEVSGILESIDLKDYPEVDVYDYMNLKLKSGPHGITAAGRKVYLLNKELFKNELKEIPHRLDVSEFENKEIERKYSTCLCFEDDEYASVCKKYDDPVIICECNSLRTGGKYDQGGSITLEEKLCKITNLSLTLYKHGDTKLKCVRESNINVDNIYPLENSEYIKDVRFIRHEETYDYRLLDDFNEKCDVILTPCLNMSKIDKDNNCNLLVGSRLSKAAFDILHARLYESFYVSYLAGKKSVIINDFGNGFHIDLDDAANLIINMINEFDGVFKNIVINCKMKGKVKKNFIDKIGSYCI